MAKKKNRTMLSSYTIIILLIIGLAILSWVLPDAKYQTETLDGRACVEQFKEDDSSLTSCVFDSENLSAEDCAAKMSEDEEAIPSSCTTEVLENGSGTVGATLSQVLKAPILGFENAIDVAIFIMILGGFLKIMDKTKALETGIKVLVQKLHGRELWLIPILMLIFSICGTTYGMLEETVGFYVLLAATMFAAGMDPLVGSAVILLGAGSGVLGSTINPFATGVALSSLPSGVAANQGLVIFIAVVLWLTTYAISTLFVLAYAKKVKKDKGSTILSLREQQKAEKTFGKFAEASKEKARLTGKQKVTLWLFALTFVIMIIGFIPWGEFNITFFNSFTGWLTGEALGDWWFYEAALWFFIMSLIISFINGYGEKDFVDTFVDGADDMIGVILVIAVARGASVLMSQTFLDNFIIYNASDFLSKLPEILFVPLNYVLHIVLSILVPSSSGMATLSTPIIAPLTANLGYSTEVSIMTIVSANGLVNLISPTCGAIMGGLALAKIEYSTWFKWAFKVVLTIALVNILVLVLFSVL
mgnify:FL=1